MMISLISLDQLNSIIDATFSSVEKIEPFLRYTTLQSLYTPARWTVGSTRIRAYTMYSTRVVEPEDTNPYD